MGWERRCSPRTWFAHIGWRGRLRQAWSGSTAAMTRTSEFRLEVSNSRALGGSWERRLWRRTPASRRYMSTWRLEGGEDILPSPSVLGSILVLRHIVEGVALIWQSSNSY